MNQILPEGPFSDLSLSLKIHHIGVITGNLNRSLKSFCGIFGFKQVTDPIRVEPQQVDVCFLKSRDNQLIELINPYTPESPVANLLKQNSPGPYHLCFEVDNLVKTLTHLKAKKCRELHRFEMPEYGRFAFLQTPDWILFELFEKDPSKPQPS